MDKFEELRLKHNKINEGYEGDIKRYCQWCSVKKMGESISSMLEYLYYSLKIQKVKMTTWERRYQSIKSYLEVKHGIKVHTSEKCISTVDDMRLEFREPEHTEQLKINVRPPGNKKEILMKIYSLPIREKTIYYLNLITASRSHEMVKFKILDFDLERRLLNYLSPNGKKKYSKRLNPEAVKMIKEYIELYDLKPDSYFVGKTYRGGRYESKEISVQAYQKAVLKTLGITSDVLRKTIGNSMHEAGADIPTIQRQTGIKCRESLFKHYLTVTDSTLDKYI